MIERNLDTFLYWIKERHSIFLKKESGRVAPWTADPILQEYKFTNPFRQNDRVTRELASRLTGYVHEDAIFNAIIIFRMFNLDSTYGKLYASNLTNKWSTAKAKKILHKRKEQGHKVFTGAYIITNSGSTRSKIDLVCEAVGSILKDTDSIVKDIKESNSLEYACSVLERYLMVGKFISYELVTDLRHTHILHNAKDIYTWANPGPGCKRGIHRILFDTVRGDLPRGLVLNNVKVCVDYQEEMKKLLKIVQKKLGKLKNFQKTVFEMRDIEHSLCEFDKYMRVKNGEGRPRSKYPGGKR